MASGLIVLRSSCYLPQTTTTSAASAAAAADRSGAADASFLPPTPSLEEGETRHFLAGKSPDRLQGKQSAGDGRENWRGVGADVSGRRRSESPDDDDRGGSAVRRVLRPRDEEWSKLPLWCDVTIVPELPSGRDEEDGIDPMIGSGGVTSEFDTPRYVPNGDDASFPPSERSADVHGAAVEEEAGVEAAAAESLFHSPRQSLNPCGTDNILVIPPDMISSNLPIAGGEYLLSLSSCRTALPSPSSTSGDNDGNWRRRGAEKDNDSGEQVEVPLVYLPVHSIPSTFSFELEEPAHGYDEFEMSDGTSAESENDQNFASEGLVANLDTTFDFSAVWRRYVELIEEEEKERRARALGGPGGAKEEQNAWSWPSIWPWSGEKDERSAMLKDPVLKRKRKTDFGKSGPSHHSGWRQDASPPEHRTDGFATSGPMAEGAIFDQRLILLHTAMDREARDLNVLLNGLGCLGMLLGAAYAYAAHKIILRSRNKAKENEEDWNWNVWVRLSSGLAFIRSLYQLTPQSTCQKREANSQQEVTNSVGNGSIGPDNRGDECANSGDAPSSSTDGPNTQKAHVHEKNEKKTSVPQSSSNEKKENVQKPAKAVGLRRRTNFKSGGDFKALIKRAANAPKSPKAQASGGRKSPSKSKSDAARPKKHDVPSPPKKKEPRQPSLRQQKKAVDGAVNAILARLQPGGVDDDDTLASGSKSTLSEENAPPSAVQIMTPKPPMSIRDTAPSNCVSPPHTPNEMSPVSKSRKKCGNSSPRGSSTPLSTGRSVGEEASNSSATARGDSIENAISPLTFKSTQTNRRLTFSPKKDSQTTPKKAFFSHETKDILPSPVEQEIGKDVQIHNSTPIVSSPARGPKCCAPENLTRAEGEVASPVLEVGNQKQCQPTPPVFVDEETESLAKSPADLSPCARLARDWEERRRKATPTKTKLRPILTPPPSLLEATPPTAGSTDSKDSDRPLGVDAVQGDSPLPSNGQHTEDCPSSSMSGQVNDQSFASERAQGNGSHDVSLERINVVDRIREQEQITSLKARGVLKPRFSRGRPKLRPISDNEANGPSNDALSSQSFASEIAKFRLKPDRKVGKIDIAKVEGTFLKEYWDD